MEEKDFNSQTQQFVQNVSQHIAYIYTAFVPEGCENILNTMKSDIWPAERHLLPNRRASALRFICPYDLMMNGMDKKIREFYAEFQLSDKTQRQLAHYGDRAEILTKQFQKELDTAYRTTIRTARRELDLMVMQGKTAKETITHMRMVLNKRINTLKKQLQNFAGQTERIMVLWEYQDCGYERYRYVSVGETCDDCTALDGEIFAISELQPGVNFGPLHPNCDCRADILDHTGAVVFSFMADKKDDETKSPPQKTKSFWDYFSLKTLQESDNYLAKSLRQLLLGNYTDDVTFLGTLAEIAAGLVNLDLPMDIRDLVYDVTHWENTPKHAVQTLLDIVALLPVIGSTKYGDEVGALIKSVFKHGDKAADLAKSAIKHGDEAADAAKAAAKHADEVADAAKAATDVVDSRKVYNANRNPILRQSRRLSYDNMLKNGLEVNGNDFSMNPHAYNSLFKSGRKDIMPDDIIDALKTTPSPGTAGSLKYVNPHTGTHVFVNAQNNEIVGIWPKEFIK